MTNVTGTATARLGALTGSAKSAEPVGDGDRAGMICEGDGPLLVVFGAGVEGPIAVAEVERSDWPRRFVRRGGIGAFCADFWRLVAKGPVAVWFEDRLEGYAIVEAYAEARRRRLH
jgi:hypothetical protein